MLDSLYFGKDDAETDIGHGGLLASGFVKTTAYENALNGQRWLILGRKGSGKSAICLTIRRQYAQKEQVCLVTPDEISAEEIKRFEMGGITPYQTKELLWRYVFAVQIAKFLLKVSDRAQAPKPQIAKKIRQFLLDNNEAEDISVTERFWRTIEKLKATIKIGAFKGVEVSATFEASSGVKLSDGIEYIEAHLKNAAVALGIDRPSFFLLIDQVESIWSNDPGSDALVIGLLRAAKRLQSLPFLRCVVFLRVDIYEKLNFSERDKLRSDEFLIRWDREDLIKLVEARAGASTKGKIKQNELWHRVFPRKVGDVDIKKFISGRTLNRPRDIIQLCNACRDLAKSKGRETIGTWDVLTAAKQYSRWKLGDIQNEWLLNYPFLAEALLLLSNGSYLFHREIFKAKFRLVASDLASRYPAIRHLLSADYILAILFSTGVLGVVRGDNPLYSSDSDAEEKLKTNDDTFVVHPAFRDALQCLSAINLSPFEETSSDETEAVISRLRRRSLGASHEDSSDPGEYFIREISNKIVEIRHGVADSELSVPVKEELRLNFASVEAELKKAMMRFDETEQRDTLERIGQFFREMSKRLSLGKLLSPKHDLTYQIKDVADLCQEYSLGHFSQRRLA
ncbi:MAG: hypothetical protein QOJ96_380 [Alphaproteobacteria bacterium]|nr:hypothetical protein [Alphaproteobacteria bacterium]